MLIDDPLDVLDETVALGLHFHGIGQGSREHVLVSLREPAALFALFTACRRFLFYAALLLLMGAAAAGGFSVPNVAWVAAGVGSGILFGLMSSGLAVRRYLREI